LRDGRRVQWPLNGLDALIEDPRYTIRLDEDCAIADAQAQANADPKHRTGPNIGWRKDDKGHAEAAENAGQQHVAQLASRGLNDRRFIVPVCVQSGWNQHESIFDEHSGQLDVH